MAEEGAFARFRAAWRDLQKARRRHRVQELLIEAMRTDHGEAYTQMAEIVDRITDRVAEHNGWTCLTADETAKLAAEIARAHHNSQGLQ